MDNELVNATRINQNMVECFRDMSKWLQETKAAPKLVPKESNDLVRQKANALYADRKFDEAIVAYSELLGRNIGDDLRAVILSNRAQCYLMLRKYRKCINDASESLTLKQTDKAYFRRASAYQALTHYEDAERDLVACREMVQSSDLAARQRIDDELRALHVAREREQEARSMHARRVLCSNVPGWTFSAPESDFKDIPIEGIRSVGIVKEKSEVRVIKAPTEKYVPRCQRINRSFTVN